jgi:hypothetical protein
VETVTANQMDRRALPPCVWGCIDNSKARARNSWCLVGSYPPRVRQIQPAPAWVRSASLTIST